MLVARFIGAPSYMAVFFFLALVGPFTNASEIILLGQGSGSAIVFQQIISVPTHSSSDFPESIFVPSIVFSDLHFVLAGPSFVSENHIRANTLGRRVPSFLGRAITSLDHV